MKVLSTLALLFAVSNVETIKIRASHDCLAAVLPAPRFQNEGTVAQEPAHEKFATFRSEYREPKIHPVEQVSNHAQ